MTDRMAPDNPAARNSRQPSWDRYLLSLPERVVRSLASLAGGTSLLLTETLLPDFLKATTAYRVFIGDLQQFMIARVAQVDLARYAEERRSGDYFLHQKMAGGALETIGLLTIHFSPLWIFAIAGDAAAGGKVFLQRLVEHLKRNGVVGPEANPHSLVDLLDAIQAASRSSTAAIDTPPLTRSQLAAMSDELLASYGRLFSSSQSAASRFAAIAGRMEETAQAQGVPVETISGLMAIDLASLSRTGLATSAALSRTGSELFAEEILASYGRTLDRIGQQGLNGYLEAAMKPFLQAAAGHFDPRRPTSTEKFLSRNKADG